MLYDVNSKQFKALLVPLGDSKIRHKSRANVAHWVHRHQASSSKKTDKNAQSVKPTSA